MKRIVITLILFTQLFLSSTCAVDMQEHKKFVQGYVQAMHCEQVKYNNQHVEFYHRRSLLLASLLGVGATTGGTIAAVPLLLLSNDTLAEVVCKGLLGVIGGGMSGLCVYKLMKMYSTTPLIIFNDNGLQVPGKPLIVWADVDEVCLTESVQEISSGSTLNNTGFIATSFGSKEKIVTYGVAIKNKYGQTVYAETEKILPVEALSFCKLAVHYVNFYKAGLQVKS